MKDAALGFKIREVILSSLELMLQFEKELLDAPGQGYKYLVLSNVTKLVFSKSLESTRTLLSNIYHSVYPL